MKNRDLTRRSFVKQSFALAAPAVLAANALPLSAAEPDSGATRKLRVVCVGGHPDDPESGCAGTLTRYAELGHALTVIYLTRGERGISGKSLDEAARIRSAECEAACKIMGAKPVFFGQIDGATELNKTPVSGRRKPSSTWAATVKLPGCPGYDSSCKNSGERKNPLLYARRLRDRHRPPFRRHRPIRRTAGLFRH